MRKIRLLLFVITLFAGLCIPPFDGADVIGAQWLYLSLHLFTSLILLSFSKITLERSLLKNKYILFFLAFYLIMFLSILSSENINESFFVIGRLLIIPIEIILFVIVLKGVKEKKIFISYAIVVFLVYELYLVLDEFIYITRFLEYSFEYAVNLKGNTGNKNIAAASIAVKFPFLIYLILKLKNQILKVLLYCLIILSSFSIAIISSRAIILAFIFSLVAYSIYVLFKDRKKITHWMIIIISTISLSSSNFIFSNNSIALNERLSSIVNYSESESSKIRLRYYKHGLKQIKENPILGCGIGNWKIKSIYYDKSNIDGYIVPYNLHNDFLEIAAETGLFGLICYLGLFLMFFYNQLKLLLNKSKLRIWDLTILLSLLIYFIDANLNFPMQRVTMTIMFITLFALIIDLDKEITNEN